MDNGLQTLVAGLQLTIKNVKKIGINLKRDFPNDADDEQSRLGIKWQEEIHQQSRNLMFDYSECPRTDEEHNACLDAIKATIPLLEGSQYAKMQKDRIKELEAMHNYSRDFMFA